MALRNNETRWLGNVHLLISNLHTYCWMFPICQAHG